MKLKGFAYAPGVHCRAELGTELKSRGLVGDGVEIGTHRGEFAEALLDKWPGFLTCVDPWDNPPGYDAQAKMLEGGGKDRNEDLLICRRRLARFPQQVQYFRGVSFQALTEFPANHLDFVYIDGDHRTPAFAFDLYRWYDKVKPGGMIAGHDWLLPNEAEDHSWGKGIQQMVHMFAMGLDVPVYLVPEPDGYPWSFYFFKPE